MHDTLRRVGYHASDEELQRFVGKNASQDRNRLQLVALAVWLLGEDWFNTAKLDGSAVLELLDQSLQPLAEASQANKYVNDSERREEFARYLLARLDYRPAGESLAQATDRLSALSSTERKRLLQESREAERRARAIRDALAKKRPNNPPTSGRANESVFRPRTLPNPDGRRRAHAEISARAPAGPGLPQ